MRHAIVIAIAAGGILAASTVGAQNGNPENRSANTQTIAVFGDWPYSPGLLAAAPLLVDSINGDPQVRLVLHVGDI